jgi:ABC-type multidrug transport system fused ATPase/permease subunit
MLTCLAAIPLWAFFMIDTVKFSIEAHSKDEVYDVGARLALWFLYLGFGTTVGAILREIGFRVFYATQMAHVRHAYYRAVLSQEMGWHDRNNSADVANRLISHMDRISSVYDFDIAFFFNVTGTAIVSIIIALVEDWKLTLATVSVYPVVLLAFYLNLRFVRKGSEVSRTAFARGAQIASEDVGLIRTIWTFCTQMHESSRFVSF